MSIFSDVLGGIVGGVFDLVGAKYQSDLAGHAADANADLQRQFAQHGVRWRVEDAKAAGLHPLFALGAQTHAASPVYMPGDFQTPISNMGQNINRAISAGLTPEERALAKLRVASVQADLDGKIIENQIRASELSRIQNGPAISLDAGKFIPGQGLEGAVDVQPSRRFSTAPGALHEEAAWQAGVSWERTPRGLVAVIPQGLSESYEDDIIGKTLWNFRNRIMPNFGLGTAPSKSRLPKGYDYWSWNHFKQQWEPRVRSVVRKDREGYGRTRREETERVGALGY